MQNGARPTLSTFYSFDLSPTSCPAEEEEEEEAAPPQPVDETQAETPDQKVEEEGTTTCDGDR